MLTNKCFCILAQHVEHLLANKVPCYGMVNYVVPHHVMLCLYYFSWKHVLILNISLLSVCVVFAIFLPHIGKIIG